MCFRVFPACRFVYGCETWTIAKADEPKREAFHMSCQRQNIGSPLVSLRQQRLRQVKTTCVAGSAADAWQSLDMFVNSMKMLQGIPQSVAPEAVWQVGRPPYQSEIWYGGAIPIRDAGISLVLIPKNSLFHYFFHSTSLPITFTNRHLNSAYLPTY